MARFDHTAYAMADEDALWFGGLAGRGAGRNNIYGAAGDDMLKGTAGGDNFHVEQNNRGDGGNDVLRGGAGDDKFFFGPTYTSDDIVYGGDGLDRLILVGSLERELAFTSENLRSVEHIKGEFGEGDFKFTIENMSSRLIFRSYLTQGDLTIDASQSGSHGVRLIGDAGDDVLTGSVGDDVISGRVGRDVLTGGPGRDTFKYINALESTDRGDFASDLITDFARGDRVLLPERDTPMGGFHLGVTEGHVGDVVVTYNQRSDRTQIDVFTNDDDVADMTIIFNGDLRGIQVHHGDVLAL